MKKSFLKKKVSLVLLCNVDPKGVIHTKRKNIQDRINDFEKSLPFWFSLDLFKNIIVIENSNFKGDLFKKHIKQSINKKNIELIVYDGQKYNRKLGKGYGWFQQIDKVITNTIDMYGSIKGIAGNAIQPVNALELIDFDEEELENDLED